MCPVFGSQAFAVMEQLRTHCASEISDMERTMGCQEELLTALKHAYPEQVSVSSSA